MRRAPNQKNQHFLFLGENKGGVRHSVVPLMRIEPKSQNAHLVTQKEQKEDFCLTKRLKSFRLSDECLNIINSQPGKTQTEKLEYLIFRRAWEQTIDSELKEKDQENVNTG